MWIINPDLLTVKIVEEERLATEDAKLAAVQRVEAWLYASIDAYQTIGVETVLSSSKYRALVARAHDRGFLVRMIYVVLANVELQRARIRQRVQDGGHDVPADKIAARRRRSFEQLCWFAEQVDDLFVFDNSSGPPDLVVQKTAGRLQIMDEMPVDLFDMFAAYDLLRLDDTGGLD